MDILTTTSPSGDRIQLIGLSMTDLVSLALEAALNDPQGLAGINEDTEISLEVAVADDYDGATLYARFEADTDFEIVRELDGSLKVIDLDPAGSKAATVHLMIANREAS